MSQIPNTVPVGGPFAPTGDADTYGVTDPRWGIGGFSEWEQWADVLAIPKGRRRLGMVVHNQNIDTLDAIEGYYKLITDPAGDVTVDGDWEVFIPTIAAINYWTKTVNNLSYTEGNIGIGIVTPTTALDVVGTINTNAHNSSVQWKAGYDYSLISHIPVSEKGTPLGVAELGADGFVLNTQLPSYVDDVLEFPTFGDFPATGETGKIYIALDTNITYRWSGTVYVKIGSDLALGETSATAYRGDRGKIAYDHSLLVAGNPHQVTWAGLIGTPPILSQWDDVTGGINYAGGYVGIGTTSPKAKLHTLGGEMYITGSGNTSSYGYIKGVETTANTHTMTFGTTFGYNVKVDALSIYNGNIGIGTTAPTDALQVHSGGGFFSGIMTNTTTSSLGVKIGKVDSTFTSLTESVVGSLSSGVFGAINGDLGLFTRSTTANNNIRFFTGNTTPIQRMHIRYDGNVGIGTTAPTSKLHVITTDVDNGLACNISQLGTGARGLSVNTVSTTTSDYTACFMRNSVSTLFIAGNGMVGIGTDVPSYKLDVNGTGRFVSTVLATNFILSSDIKLKTNIREARVVKLPAIKEFIYKKDKTKRIRRGVIAQELEVDSPEMVHKQADGMLGVDYTDYLLAKIVELESRLNKLEGK